jgi:hypothetical protein
LCRKISRLPAPGLPWYLWLRGWLCRRRLLLFLTLLLAPLFRGVLSSPTRLLGYLRGCALGRGWLVVALLLLEYGTLTLLGLLLKHLLLLVLESVLACLFLPLLEHSALALLFLVLLERRALPFFLLLLLLLLEGALTLLGLLLKHLLLLLLEGALAFLFLPLLELLLGLLLLTLLTVTAGFFLQSPPLGLALHT